jgi:hypothetical protein
MTTETDIANLALGVLDEAPISAISDNNTAARLANLHFAQTRKAELSKHLWAFALAKDTLTGTDLDTGEGTYNWSYTIPANVLRIVPITYDGEPTGIPINWRQFGTKILSDQEGPLTVLTVKDKTDPTDWSPLFTEVMVAALAVKMALPLTHKAGMIEVAKAAYQTAIADATRANAFLSGQYNEALWSSQRGDNRYWRA